ncbi:MAG: hydrogenase 2 protein HybA [Rhodocyclaceae bacterium]|jgi:Fe-S-cluster-containing dehydrogenase component|nr:hydrogenase 2 protein HybA [Rhodocyclaceae bacterium]
MDRRKFFKASLAGGTLLAAGAGCPVQARENKTMPPEAVGLLFDSTLCVGCKACVAACKEANGMPVEFSTQEQYWDTPLDLSGKTLTVIKAYRHGSAENKDQAENGYAFVKKSCLHCVDPSCVSACPVSAMQKDPQTGVVSYDKEACIGCRYCVAACPFGVPRFTYDQALPQISKCQLCRHRWKDGKYAACAEVCPTGATLYGTVADINKEIARRKTLKAGSQAMFPRGKLGGPDQSYPNVVGKYIDHVYGEKEFGGTQMVMLSGVPFEKLGYPDLPPRSDARASETLQHTLYGGLIAPLAFLGVLSYVAKRNAKPEGEEGGQNE